MLRAKSPIYNKNNQRKEFNQKQKRGATKLFIALNNISFKKIRYTFQVLKQFYLFSDSASSSITSLSSYDKLIFNDQAIHTLVKKLQTKILQRKIWAFINLKVLRIIQQVKKLESKMSKIVINKQIKFKSSAFSRIRVYSYDYQQRQSKNSQPIINSYKNIAQTRTKSPINSYTKITQIQNSTTIISQSRISHISSIRTPNQIHVHRGSSRSLSPNSSYTRIITQPQSRAYIQAVRISPGKVKLHDVQPRRSIQIIQRSPRKYQYDVDQVRREYGDCYRVPSRIRIVSCGCRDITVKSCDCSGYISRTCGCHSCSHICNGCNTCNNCHCHCCCSRSCSRSCSRQNSTNKSNSNGPRIKQVIVIKKSPQKQMKNRYLDHLQNVGSQNKIRTNISPSSHINRGSNVKYEYSETRTTQIRRV